MHKGQAENVVSLLLLVATLDKVIEVSMLNDRLLEKREIRSHLSGEARL